MFKHAWRLAVCCLLAAGVAQAGSGHEESGDWPMFGRALNNTSSTDDTTIGPNNVGRLMPKWVFTTHGDVSARASVVDGSVYFPDFGGFLYRLDADTGQALWVRNLGTDYGLSPSSFIPILQSRTTPAIQGDTLYIGTQLTANGAWLLAIRTRDGALKWKTRIDTHPMAAITTAPVILAGVVYVGVSSLEEAAAADTAYPCCSFRGSAAAVDARTGAVLWKIWTAPPGYTGASVWGSSLVPDPVRGNLYITTGNNYKLPSAPAFNACVNGRAPEDAVVSECIAADDLVDTVAALDMRTGRVKWSHRFGHQDDWNAACLVGYPPGAGNCPYPMGPDFDFSSGANLFEIDTHRGHRTVLGVGQKSGVYSELDPATGALIMARQVGPGGPLGGIEWGSATDGERIYIPNANSQFLPNQDPAMGSAGTWTAIDAVSGRIIWQVPDPNGTLAFGPVTLANGVVFAPSMGYSPSAPTMLALDARTGQTLWRFAAGSSVAAGATVVGDSVYWGSGYTHLAAFGLPFTGNNRFYAFKLRAGRNDH